MSKFRKTLVTLLVLGVVGTLAGVGTFSAFSSTTDNTGNTFAAGTVYIGDNDAGSAMYNVTDQKPGDVTTKCIRLTYTGSLAADVKLYTSSTVQRPRHLRGPVDRQGHDAGRDDLPELHRASCRAQRLLQHPGELHDHQELLRQRDPRLPGRADPAGTRTTPSSTGSR